MSIVQTTPRNSDSSASDSPDLKLIQDSESNQKLIRQLDAYYSDCKKYRLQFENQWFLNLAFYFGRQYVQWTNTRAGAINMNRLIEPAAPPWRVRLIINKVRSTVRKEMSKITKERPVGFVIPKSTDDQDLLAAKAGDSLVEYFWREKKYMRELRRAVFWSTITGTGFLKDWYDPDAMTPDEQQGDMFVERISPFHIYIPNVQEEEIESQPYVIHSVGKTPDEVEIKYGIRPVADSKSSSSPMDEKFLNVLGIRESNNKDLVNVKEIWIKPNAKFKEGAVVVWAGSQILHMEEGWPYTHKQFPFSKIDHIPTGRFYAESTVTDLIPLQKEYNRGRSQIMESRNRMSKPQLVAPKGSIDPNKMTSEPGLIILYQPGFSKPEAIPPPNLPSYVIEELNRTLSDMNDISSQHEISQGQTPPGVSAATAISYLQEQDDTVLSYTTQSVEEVTEKVSRHFLSHVTQFWDSARQIQVVGDNRQFEVFELDKDALHNNTNFMIQIGSSTPRSLAAKQAFIMELGKMGWIPPDKALRYLDMAETSKLYEEMQLDARQAQRENIKFKIVQIPPVQNDPTTGQPAPIDPNQLHELGVPSVNTWDNHIAHVMEHDNFRKGQIYDGLAPETKMVLEDHVQKHKIFILLHKGIDPNVIQQVVKDPNAAMIIEHLLYAPTQSSVPPVGNSQPEPQPAAAGAQ